MVEADHGMTLVVNVIVVKEFQQRMPEYFTFIFHINGSEELVDARSFPPADEAVGVVDVASGFDPVLGIVLHYAGRYGINDLWVKLQSPQVCIVVNP